MRYQVAIAIITSDKEYPSGTVSAGIKVTLGDAFQMMTSNPVIFDGVAPATYPITIQAVTATGAGIGAMLTGSVTVESGTVMVSTPCSFAVSVTLTPGWDGLLNVDSIPSIDSI